MNQGIKLKYITAQCSVKLDMTYFIKGFKKDIY